MEAVVAALTEQDAELDELVAPLDDDDWSRPSPCAGWNVADVLLHLAQTDELAVASVTGRVPSPATPLAPAAPLAPGAAGTVDDAAAHAVALERGAPGAVVAQRWRGAAAEQRRVLAACDPHARVPWVSGRISARTLASTRLAETWIHTGDVARALGLTVTGSDRLWHVARLAWRTLPYAFERAGRVLAGPVAFALRAPSGDTWEFGLDDQPHTVVRGDALELCLVAARRVAPSETALVGEGPDAAAVLELVRTYA